MCHMMMCRSDRPLYGPKVWDIEEAKQLGSTGAVKRHSKNNFTSHPTPHTTRPIHRGIQQLSLKWVPWLPWGLPKLRAGRQNPSMGQSCAEQLEWGTKRHKGWPIFWRTRCPIEGTRHPQALYLSLDQEVSFTSLHVGWHRAIRIFS
jgi:hypothetical protein